MIWWWQVVMYCCYSLIHWSFMTHEPRAVECSIFNFDIYFYSFEMIHWARSWYSGAGTYSYSWDTHYRHICTKTTNHSDRSQSFKCKEFSPFCSFDFSFGANFDKIVLRIYSQTLGIFMGSFSFFLLSFNCSFVSHFSLLYIQNNFDSLKSHTYLISDQNSRNFSYFIDDFQTNQMSNTEYLIFFLLFFKLFWTCIIYDSIKTVLSAYKCVFSASLSKRAQCQIRYTQNKTEPSRTSTKPNAMDMNIKYGFCCCYFSFLFHALRILSFKI